LDESELDTPSASLPLVSGQWNNVSTTDVENGNLLKPSSLDKSFRSCSDSNGYNHSPPTTNPLRLRRLVSSSGVWNGGADEKERKKRWTFDLFTTMVDSQWRWTIIFFLASFYVSWLFFAFIYWTIAYYHGDFTGDSPHQGNGSEGGQEKCLENVRGFSSLFMFSLETQTTIGFGFSRVTEHCPIAIATLSLQAILGVIIEAFVVGVVFVKLTRAKKRAQQITFSERAVIAPLDGRLCLVFRLQDRCKRSAMIGCRIKVHFVQSRTTREGHVIAFDQQQLKLWRQGDGDICLMWPCSVIHPIDPDSPLYHIAPDQLLQHSFEIIVTVEATTGSTNMATQTLTSYLPTEIKWGYFFREMMSINPATGNVFVNDVLFNDIYKVDAPTCSGAEYASYN